MFAKLELRRTVHVNDLRQILANPREIERAAFNTEKLPEAVAVAGTRGATLYEDGQPIVAGGLTPLTEGYLIAWMVACKPLGKYIRRVWPEVKRLFDETHGSIVLANINDGFPETERFITHLGFQPAKKYPGSHTFVLRT